MLSKRRTINGHVRLGVPYGLTNEYAKGYMRKGKSISLSGLLMYSDAHIIDTFQARFRGIAEYYRYAVNVHQLSSLKNIMQQSLVKTLAHKFKISVPRIYRKYRGTQVVDDYTYKTLQVEIPTKHGTRTIYWGAIPLRTQNAINQPLRDFKDIRYGSSTDLIQRLQADKCEICGSQDNCEVHHVRKLSDLKRRWAGRKEKPTWVVRMIAMQRKTLVVCRNCHNKIHAGQALPNKKQ